tara:strand:+ start:2557 stop:3750 length:1194 start_codon:yes stop_codon:yes gene_type:complete
MKIYPIKGIKLSSIHSGMYRKKRLDLSILELPENSIVKAVYTKNKARSSTIDFSNNNLKKKSPKYLIVNSGNANAGTGKYGILDIRKYCGELAKVASCNVNDILAFSTGIIGERIHADKISKSIPTLYKNLKEDNWLNLAKSIMTTDTKYKIFSKRIKIKKDWINVTGVAKGSGMIKPNMATMLSFIATDLDIDKTSLSKIQKSATEKSFNMISVDGETSTNDASVIMSTRQSKLSYKKLTKKEKEKFINIIYEAHIHLAQKIVNDGEGATKFITINVSKCSSYKEAKSIAMSVGNSLLVKTALFAEDPNWGRIISAIGNVETKEKNLSKYTVSFGKNLVFKNNYRSKNYDEKILYKYLTNKEIEINICCNTGNETATVWTSDLTYKYIKINAEYRT